MTDVTGKEIQDLAAQRMQEHMNKLREFANRIREEDEKGKTFTIFICTANPKGDYDIGDAVEGIVPTKDKSSLENICDQLNAKRPDSWHYYQIYQTDETGTKAIVRSNVINNLYK